jgi:hypothetical protein
MLYKILAIPIVGFGCLLIWNYFMLVSSGNLRTHSIFGIYIGILMIAIGILVFLLDNLSRQTTMKICGIGLGILGIALLINAFSSLEPAHCLMIGIPALIAAAFLFKKSTEPEQVKQGSQIPSARPEARVQQTVNPVDKMITMAKQTLATKVTKSQSNDLASMSDEDLEREYARRKGLNKEEVQEDVEGKPVRII